MGDFKKWGNDFEMRGLITVSLELYSYKKYAILIPSVCISFEHAHKMDSQ